MFREKFGINDISFKNADVNTIYFYLFIFIYNCTIYQMERKIW